MTFRLAASYFEMSSNKLYLSEHYANAIFGLLKLGFSTIK